MSYCGPKEMQDMLLRESEEHIILYL